jgi:hypothetical protein
MNWKDVNHDVQFIHEVVVLIKRRMTRSPSTFYGIDSLEINEPGLQYKYIPVPTNA